jgi:hypothetical protein
MGHHTTVSLYEQTLAQSLNDVFGMRPRKDVVADTVSPKLANQFEIIDNPPARTYKSLGDHEPNPATTAGHQLSTAAQMKE